MSLLPLGCYQSPLALVAAFNLDRHAELALRRLIEYVIDTEESPANDDTTLITLTRCPPRRWPSVRQALLRAGWAVRSGHFVNPQLSVRLAALRQAEAQELEALRQSDAEDLDAYREFRAQENARLRRWRDAQRETRCETRCETPMKRAAKRVTSTQQHSEPAPIADSDLGTRPALKLKNDKVPSVPSLLSVKRPERLTFKGSTHCQNPVSEGRFLADVLETMTLWSPKHAQKEAENWGGWWRLRFRENPDKAQRVLAEIRSMIRERRIRSNPGAAATDLWKRFPA